MQPFSLVSLGSITIRFPPCPLLWKLAAWAASVGFSVGSKTPPWHCEGRQSLRMVHTCISFTVALSHLVGGLLPFPQDLLQQPTQGPQLLSPFAVAGITWWQLSVVTIAFIGFFNCPYLCELSHCWIFSHFLVPVGPYVLLTSRSPGSPQLCCINRGASALGASGLGDK